MTEEKLYRVEINDDNGKLRNVVLTPNAVIQSFSTDAKKIMFELRVTNLQAFNKIQKIIGIRQTNEQQTLWTDEIEKINNWFNNAENLYFFINEYASNHNPLLGTPLNIKIGKIKKSDVNDYIIDNPISHNKYDFEKRQPRTIANQNLLRFKHSFYNYIMSMYSTEEKQVDWK